MAYNMRLIEYEYEYEHEHEHEQEQEQEQEYEYEYEYEYRCTEYDQARMADTSLIGLATSFR